MPNASMLREYLKIFKGEFGSQAQNAVYNCLSMIDYARNRDIINKIFVDTDPVMIHDISNENFSNLDLRSCVLSGKNNCNSDFSNSYIHHDLFFAHRHTNEVTSVCYSPDGKHIVSSSLDSSVKIWDGATGALMKTLYVGTHETYRATYSPNGKFIAATSQGSLMIWSSNDGTLLHSIDCGAHEVSFSPCGRYVATSSFDEFMDKFIIIDNAIGETIYEGWAGGELLDIFFLPDGKRLVTATPEETIVWDIPDKKMAGVFESAAIADFSVDGKYVVTSNGKLSKEKDEIKIWDTENFKLIKNLGEGYSAQFTPDGKYVAAFSDVQIYKIWKVGTWELKHTWESNSELHWRTQYKASHINYSPDGKYIAAVPDNTGEIAFEIRDSWSGDLVRTIQSHNDEHFKDLFFTPDSKTIVTFSYNDGAVKIWDVEKCRLTR